MKPKEKKWIVLLQCALTAVIFLTDLFIPLGVAAGIPYIAVVLICLWLQGRSLSLLWAFICSFLTLVKLVFATPTEIAVPWVILSNRILSVGAIVIVALVVRSYKRFIDRAEREVRQYAEKLENSNRELEHFAYIASHDLQEPLRKIQAFSSRMLENGNYDGENSDYLERITNAAKRMQELINDLLSYSRVSSRELKSERVSMGNVLQEVLNDLELPIASTGATIVVGKLPEVKCYTLQLRQLFQNLISNSLKFRRENVKPVIRIASMGIKSGMYIIRYEDNGIGISPGSTEKVFNVFYREHGRKFSGSGIGLSICRKIMDRLGGKILVDPAGNEGVMFELSFSVVNGSD